MAVLDPCRTIAKLHKQGDNDVLQASVEDDAAHSVRWKFAVPGVDLVDAPCEELFSKKSLPTSNECDLVDGPHTPPEVWSLLGFAVAEFLNSCRGVVRRQVHTLAQ